MEGTDGMMISSSDKDDLEAAGKLMEGYEKLPIFPKEPTLYSKNEMTQVIIPEFLAQLKKLPLQLVLDRPNHLRFKSSADIEFLEERLSEMGLNCCGGHSGPYGPNRDHIADIRNYDGLAYIKAKIFECEKLNGKQRTIIGTLLDIYVEK